jgi:hypothetical protein
MFASMKTDCYMSIELAKNLFSSFQKFEIKGSSLVLTMNVNMSTGNGG